MTRALRTYEGDDRRYIDNNLMCTWCGNTNTFNIDLKLDHIITVKNGQLEISLCKINTNRTLNVIKENMDDLVEKCYDGEDKTFYCANCEGIDTLDYHKNIIESCYHTACLGCFHCQNYIDKSELLEICRECITENNGKVDDEFCDTICPASDFGLREIHHHYDITLHEIKTDLGY